MVTQSCSGERAVSFKKVGLLKSLHTIPSGCIKKQRTTTKVCVIALCKHIEMIKEMTIQHDTFVNRSTMEPEYNHSEVILSSSCTDASPTVGGAERSLEMIPSEGLEGTAP